MEIQTPEGRVKAMTPVILSASRSTDIPAYYGQWFMNRLRAGWCAWVNPFNRRPSYVSFRDVKAVVFWTKNPAPFLQHLDELDARGLHYYFQYTLNDYEREGFEPNVPALEKRIETFRRLSERIGPDRVVWRFDPIILSPGTGPRDILMRIWTIGKALRGLTKKLVVSFVDVGAYRKVQANLVRDTDLYTRETVLSAEPDEAQRREICEASPRSENAGIRKAGTLRFRPVPRRPTSRPGALRTTDASTASSWKECSARTRRSCTSFTRASCLRRLPQGRTRSSEIP